MKNKKIIAISLCIGMLTSSFGSIFVSYAKNEDVPNQYINKNITSKAPEQNILTLEPEINNNRIPVSVNTFTDSINESSVIYEGSRSVVISDNSTKGVLNNNRNKTSNTSNNSTKDMFNIGEEDIKKLIKEGFTIQEIFEADDIGNEIFIDPLKLLERKKGTNKSLKEIRDEILNERMEENFQKLKGKYEKEYKDLSDKKYNKNEIFSLLAYIDINGFQLSDKLIKEYESKGKELFKDNKFREQLSKDMKEEHQLSNEKTEESNWEGNK